GISLPADQVLVTTLLWWCFSSYHGFTFWIFLQWFCEVKPSQELTDHILSFHFYAVLKFSCNYTAEL
ncbi:hypothetical protein MUK42_27098, partial [Musa troglodytarum]